MYMYFYAQTFKTNKFLSKIVILENKVMVKIFRLWSRSKGLLSLEYTCKKYEGFKYLPQTHSHRTQKWIYAN